MDEDHDTPYNYKYIIFTAKIARNGTSWVEKPVFKDCFWICADGGYDGYSRDEIVESIRVGIMTTNSLYMLIFIHVDDIVKSVYTSTPKCGVITEFSPNYSILRTREMPVYGPKPQYKYKSTSASIIPVISIALTLWMLPILFWIYC